MKRLAFLSAACLMMLSTACKSGPIAPVASQSKVVEEGGTGPYKVLMLEDPSLEAHTIFAPQDLSPFGKKNLLPVLVWGNGACTNSPWEHYKFLNEIASYGFLVIATGYIPMEEAPYRGPMSTSAQQIESIDWAIAQNANNESPYYGRIDVEHIAAAGMSCGGLQTLDNATDPRLTTIMICNSGLFINPGTAVPNMPMPSKDRLQEIEVPVIYILGGPEDIAYENGMDDFHRLVKVPAFAANYPVGHGGTYRQEHGGEFTVPALAWLQWQLKGDKEAAKLFQGDDCGLANREGWTVEKVLGAGELLVVLGGGSLVTGLLGGGGDGEHHVGGVLHVRVDLQILLVSVDGGLGLAELRVGAGDELVGVGVLDIAVSLLESLDGIGTLVLLQEGLALLEEEVGEELVGLVGLAVGGGDLEGLDGGVVVTGLHQGLTVEKLALAIFRGEGDDSLESGGGTGEVLGLQQGGTLTGPSGRDKILGVGGNLFDTIAFGNGGGLLQRLEGLVIVGLVDLLLGDGEDGLGDNLLALGHHIGSFVLGAGLELGKGALELGQGVGLVGLKGLGTVVEGFHGGVEILGGSDSCGECERRDGDK